MNQTRVAKNSTNSRPLFETKPLSLPFFEGLLRSTLQLQFHDSL